MSLISAQTEQSNKIKYLKKRRTKNNSNNKTQMCCFLRAKHPTDYLFFVNLSTYLHLSLVSSNVGTTKLQMIYLETIKTKF